RYPRRGLCRTPASRKTLLKDSAKIRNVFQTAKCLGNFLENLFLPECFQESCGWHYFHIVQDSRCGIDET
ncbi:MAG: hypothetical protein IKH14_01940, partial [Prevotella sp.]|nr:hypothetical protein [Prevotella sp.]